VRTHLNLTRHSGRRNYYTHNLLSNCLGRYCLSILKLGCWVDGYCYCVLHANDPFARVCKSASRFGCFPSWLQLKIRQPEFNHCTPRAGHHSTNYAPSSTKLIHLLHWYDGPPLSFAYESSRRPSSVSNTSREAKYYSLQALMRMGRS
jgi:hypothetical protein